MGGCEARTQGALVSILDTGATEDEASRRRARFGGTALILERDSYNRRVRAAVLRELNEPFVVENVELAEPGPGEVEVSLSAAGVCHSDWNVVTGATTNPLPAVLGHEGAGVVAAVGEDVETVAVGDHVVLSWLPACGRCFYCAQGRQALCDVAMADMFRGTLPGGALRLSQNGGLLYHYSYLSAFAERCVVPEGCCVPIRNDAPFAVAA